MPVPVPVLVLLLALDVLPWVVPVDVVLSPVVPALDEVLSLVVLVVLELDVASSPALAPVVACPPGPPVDDMEFVPDSSPAQLTATMATSTDRPEYEYWFNMPSSVPRRPRERSGDFSEAGA